MADLPPRLRALVEAAGADATVVVSRNGGLGEVVRPQVGLEIGPAGSGPFWEASEPLPVLSGPQADLWTALNGAFAEVPWRVRVPAGVAVGAPLVVVHWLEGEGAAIFPRLEVEVAEGASVQVIEVLASPAPACSPSRWRNCRSGPVPASILAMSSCSVRAPGRSATR